MTRGFTVFCSNGCVSRSREASHSDAATVKFFSQSSPTVKATGLNQSQSPPFTPTKSARSILGATRFAFSKRCGATGLSAASLIARTPDLVAHVIEERTREKSMRRIDSVNDSYDGPPARSL